MVKRKRSGANDPTQNQQTGINLTLLPEIIFSILVRLPVYDLLRVKAVCKLWYDIVTSRDFTIANLHFWKSRPEIIVLQNDHMGYHSASFNFETKSKFRLRLVRNVYETVKIMNGLDGLLLFLVKGPTRKLFICNPITDKFKLLFYIPPWDKYEVHYALVFDSVIQSYKVIGFRYQDSQNINDKYFVLILNNEGRRCTRGGFRFPDWRNVESQFQDRIRLDFSPIAIAGFLYWVSLSFTDGKAHLQTMDIVEEVFREKIPLPSQPVRQGACRVLEMESRGSVHVAIACSKFELGIWLLNSEEDHKWIKQHSIRLESIVRSPTCYMLNAPVALDTDDPNLMKLVIQFQYHLYTYNFKNNLMTELPFRNCSSLSYVFVPSLISWE